MIRTFFLQNASGASFDLTLSGSSLLTNVGGLGFTSSANWAPLGHAWIRGKQKYDQIPITGDLILASYQRYSEFMGFYADSKDMLLVYSFDGETSYIMPVEIVSVGKSELTDGYVLSCPISILPRGPWVKASELTVSGSTINSYNAGMWPAPFRLALRFPEAVGGVLIGLDITIYHLSEYVGEWRFSLTPSIIAPALDTFIWDTRDGKAAVSFGGGSLVPALDFTKNNFPTIPRGDFRVQLSTFGTESSIAGTLTVYQESISV